MTATETAIDNKAANTARLFAKLLKVKEDVGAIGKDRRGQGINYSYRGIDDLYNALHTAFIKHGVITRTQVVPGTLQREVRELAKRDGGVKLQTQITYVMAVDFIDCDTGAAVTNTVPAEGYDDSDKAAGKAVSYGMKTAIAHALGIPTAVEEPDDERPDTSSDPETVVDAAVKRLLVAKTLEDAKKVFSALPAYAQRHPEVVKAKDAAKERLS